MAMATATPWLTTPPSGSSSRLAIAGSPMKPMPSEAIVMPSWQADRYSSMRSICFSASAAPRAPSSRSASMRDSRVRTSANSAATKKPLAATSTATPKRRSSSVISDAELLAGCYFEDRRRRSSADAAESSIASGQSGDAAGQHEVVLGEPALRVRGDRDGHLVPRDLEVGVMVHLLRLRGQPVHEVHGPLEVVELEGAPDGVTLPLPAVEPRQVLLDLLVAQTCHPHLRANRFPGAVVDRDALRPRLGRQRRRGHPRV